VRLSVGGELHERTVDVRDDPRIEIQAADRREWTDILLEIGAMYSSANSLVESVVEVEDKLEKLEEPPEKAEDEARRLHKMTFELRRRIRMLYGDVEGWTGPPTDEQRAQMTYLLEAMSQLEPDVRSLSMVELTAGEP
jgi:hypothetical protein